VHVGILPILSAPVFIVMLVITRVFAARLIARGRAPLEPLLGLQFVLLAGDLPPVSSTNREGST
jgi:hypothetical protein